jgi:hypothetical protein
MHVIHREPLRSPPTLSQKLNPFWWASDDDRNMAWPWFKWFLRNPFTNFCSCIIGIKHCPRTVVTLKPGEYTLPPSGLNWGFSYVKWLPRPFIAYRGIKWEWVAGWKTSGVFSPLTFRRANSPNATPLP